MGGREEGELVSDVCFPTTAPRKSPSQVGGLLLFVFTTPRYCVTGTVVSNQPAIPACAAAAPRQEGLRG